MQTAAWISSKGVVGCRKGSACLESQTSSFLPDWKLQVWGISKESLSVANPEICTNCFARERKLRDYRGQPGPGSPKEQRKECVPPELQACVSSKVNRAAGAGWALSAAVASLPSFPAPRPGKRRRSAGTRGRHRTCAGAIASSSGTAGGDSSHLGCELVLYSLKPNFMFTSFSLPFLEGEKKKEAKPAAIFP